MSARGPTRVIISRMLHYGISADTVAKGVLAALLLAAWLGLSGLARGEEVGQEVDCEDPDDLEAVDLGIFRCKADKKDPQSRTSPNAGPVTGGGSVYRPATGKPPAGARAIKRTGAPTDAEKIESAKHLKRILAVYDARGVWDAKRGTERYTFIPSLAARKNPALREIEEAEWKKLLARHNEEKSRQHGVPPPLASARDPSAAPGQPSPAGTGVPASPPSGSAAGSAADGQTSPTKPREQTDGAVAPPRTASGEPAPGELWRPEALEQATTGQPLPDPAQVKNASKEPARDSAASPSVVSPAPAHPDEQPTVADTPSVASAGPPSPPEEIGDAPSADPGQPGDPTTKGAPANGEPLSTDPSAATTPAQAPPAGSEKMASNETPASSPGAEQPSSQASSPETPLAEPQSSKPPLDGAPPTDEVPDTVVGRLWTPEALGEATADGGEGQPASGAAETLEDEEKETTDGGAAQSESVASTEPPEGAGEPSNSINETNPNEGTKATETTKTGGAPPELPSLFARLIQALESLTEGFWQSDSEENAEIRTESPDR